MHYHFIGICGTAMASGALLLKELGHRVSGSDQNVYPPMSTLLAMNGIDILQGYCPEHLDTNPDMVVIGNVVSRGNPEAEAALSRKMAYTSLPELLKEELIRGRDSFVVAGTHGKTTTTSLLAWVLENAGKQPGFLVGGIPLNFGQSSRAGKGKSFVIEGDEYDTAFFDKRSKFVHYLPDTLIINNIEFDHADIFNSLDDIILSFQRVVNIVPENGLILVNADDANASAAVVHAHAPVQTFGFSAGADWQAVNLSGSEDGTAFEVICRSGSDFWAFVPMWGQHNVGNALACIAAAIHYSVPEARVVDALGQFKGVKRRLEKRGDVKGIRVYDDFAHHPTAVRGTLRCVKENLPDRRVVGVFEPRSNTSRTNRMQAELADALCEADVAIVAGVHGMDRVPADKRLDLTAVVEQVTARGKKAHTFGSVDEIVAYLSKELKPNDVVVGMSNGGFDGFYDKLLRALEQRQA